MIYSNGSEAEWPTLSIVIFERFSYIKGHPVIIENLFSIRLLTFIQSNQTDNVKIIQMDLK